MKLVMLKYLKRVLVIILLHYWYKLFDPSFEEKLFLLDKRGIFFLLLWIIMGLLIWKGASLLHKQISQVFNEKYSLTTKTTLLGAVLLVYAFIGSLVASMAYRFFDSDVFYFNELSDAELPYIHFDIVFGFFFFITITLSVNGTINYIKQLKNIELYAQKLEKENLRSKYEALKNQIDPHFFFNSLSVLTSLVYKDAELSAEYITQLSLLYRHVLEKRDKNIVNLKDELEFLNAYIYLIKTRHNEMVKFNFHDSIEDEKNNFILPNSLQMLAENAIKHNKFTANEPLVIDLYIEGNCIVMKNNLKKRKLLTESSKVGLKNILLRYKLICNEDIQVIENANQFIVKLPILNKEKYASIDI